MAEIPALPQELTDYIIEQIPNDDVSSLRACAVTVRAFRHASQRKLFNHIMLNLCTTSTTIPKSLRRLEMILAASPFLVSCVRQLTIYEFARRMAEWLKSPVLPSILDLLQGISELVLDFDHRSWWDLSPALQRALQTSFARPSLQALSIVRLRFSTEAGHGMFVSIAPPSRPLIFLRHLTIQGVVIQGRLRVNSLAGHEAPVIRTESLTVEADSASEMQKLTLHTALDVSALQSMTTVMYSSLEEQMQAFWRHANRLRSLAITFMHTYHEPTALNLSSLPLLRSLDLRISPDRTVAEGHTVNPFKHVTNLLSSSRLGGSSLLELTIHVVLGEGEDSDHALDDLILDAGLAGILESLSTPLGLVRVVVHVVSLLVPMMKEGHRERALGELKRALQRVGCLEVVWVED
ncbi:hypothetical protein HMN09_01316200 [Mycena chlorophos]|uniref:F-box domain-containing protein n=1 Tax=Mycena chlorophos TaxID=658473 RepID=A0A8H6S2H6_MYCCL|nr:hypothetical protein HMN09_01316200 [Mycena chlorophos]